MENEDNKYIIILLFLFFFIAASSGFIRFRNQDVVTKCLNVI